MTTADAATTADRHWLGKGAETPTGKAWTAVQEGRLKDLRNVLATHGDAALGFARGPIGHPVSALAAAAANGDSAAVELLLEAGATTDHRACGHMMQSPLAWAIESRSLTTVRLLLDAGARTANDEDPFDLAVRYMDHVTSPHNNILEIVLDRTEDGEAGNEALHRTVEIGAPQWAAQLTARGADPNHLSTRTGQRALAAALRHDVPASPFYTSENAWRDYSESAVGIRLLNVLLERGVDLTKPLAAGGDPPLLAAVKRGAAWAVPKLIEAGADPEPVRAAIRKYGAKESSPHAVLAIFG